jgi:acyl-CoA thioester hydrolase
VDFCKAVGFRYKDLEIEHGVLLAVTESACRYLSPARYDDEIEITTTVSKATHRALTFQYKMRSIDSGRLVATGHTSHIFLNREMRPTTLPAQFRALLAIYKPEE